MNIWKEDLKGEIEVILLIQKMKPILIITNGFAPKYIDQSRYKFIQIFLAGKL